MQAAGNTNIYVILTVLISLNFFVDTGDEELDFSKDVGILLILDLFCSAFNKMIRETSHHPHCYQRRHTSCL